MREEVLLSELEHFNFCKFQWWLNYVENEWLDNTHTILGDIVHARVDDPNFVERRNGVEIRRSVQVFSKKFHLYGIADLVEFGKDKIIVVEYKKGKPSETGEVKLGDGLQLYGQMLCLRENDSRTVEGYIYYDSIRRRVKLKNEKMYHQQLLDTLNEMEQIIREGKIPAKCIDKHCRACSVYEICLPFIKGVK